MTLNGASFPDFPTWWGSLNEHFQKIFDNINYLYEKKKDSIKCLTRAEYMEIYKYFFEYFLKKELKFEKKHNI